MNKTALLLAAAFLAAAPAHADPAWLADFRKADLNDSGGLSQVELDKAKSASLKPIRDNFKAIDLDKDGQVTQEEYERYSRQPDDKLYEKLRKADLNDSGGVSRVELDKAGGEEFDVLKRNFDAIDADKDGQVTRLEYDNWRSGTASATPVAAPADRCQPNCGRVVDINIVKTEGSGSGIGAVAGGVAGGVLGKEVAGGTVATVGGAAGGAYIGHQLEKKYKTKKIIRVTVKLDNGRQQDFDLDTDKSPFVSGERVQVRDGRLVKYSGH